MVNRVKEYYLSHAETNWVKRYQSPYALRRYCSRAMWKVIGLPVKECPLVLDAGCGDGVLAVLTAILHPEQRIVAMDISREGVRAGREAAIAHGITSRVAFLVADAEHLPFKDGAFPGIVSNHVLEHLTDFDQGVREIQRVLQPDGKGVIAIPACLNPSSMVLLGGADYWHVSRRTPFAFWIGLFKVLRALLRGEEGVQEGYAGHMELPHVRRFPWRAVRRVEHSGLKVEKTMADSILIPHLAQVVSPLMRVQQRLDEKLRANRFWCNLGVGVVMVVRRNSR